MAIGINTLGLYRQGSSVVHRAPAWVKLLGLVVLGVCSIWVQSRWWLVLVAFGVDLTTEQQTALIGITGAVAPIVAAILTRQKVFSPATTVKLANRAAETAVANVPAPPADK